MCSGRALLEKPRSKVGGMILLRGIFVDFYILVCFFDDGWGYRSTFRNFILCSFCRSSSDGKGVAGVCYSCPQSERVCMKPHFVMWKKTSRKHVREALAHYYRPGCRLGMLHCMVKHTEVLAKFRRINFQS
jgi:hypothetical protein